MLLEKCPHCNASHVQGNDQWRGQFQAGDPKPGDWITTRCQNPKCNKLVLACISTMEETMWVYPAASIQLDEKLISDREIINDFKEAGSCLSVNCYKASMVMSRRVLQRCLKAQGITDHNLVDAIKHAIADGVIRKQLSNIATEIRQYGNLGAHPDDDQLSNIDKDKAQHIFDFARLLINEFFEIPAIAENLRKDREDPQPTH